MLTFNFFKKQRPRRSYYSAKDNRTEKSEPVSAFRRHKPDYSIILISIALLITGLIVVYSISPALAVGQDVGSNYYVNKQAIAIFLGLAAFVAFSIMPLRVLKNSTKSLIWFTLIMVVLVQLLGEEVNGAYRWIQVGGISFQVAELIKFTVILWLAGFMISRLAEGSIKSTNRTLIPILAVLALIGLIVVGLQSDFGSAVVCVAIIGTMAFAAGLPIKKIGLITGIVAVGLVVSVVITPYRRDRIATFINPTSDCQSAGYQSCQALIAVGSGGIFGLGIGDGVQAYGYLPEAENDSIFAIVAEKFGFIGSSAVIGLYAVLFSRMRKIIKRTSDSFSRLFVIGVLAWISTQTIINIGAMIGLLPLKGITLPLISYGGTSLVFVLAALGVVFQISRYTSYSSVRNAAINDGEGGATNEKNSFSRRRQRRPHYAASSNRF
ncbi:MAG: putative peptidoglycan glycosyltransferase FtsW [Candidatus Saccharimonadales bacterium]